MLQRKLRTQNSIKFDVTEFFIIYFFWLPPTNVVDENSDIPDQENDDIVQWPKVPPFLSFSFCARRASCMMRWHARDVRRKRHHFAFDAYIYRFFGRQKRTFRLLFCRLDLLQIRPLMLSDERWNSHTEIFLPTQRAFSVYFSFSRIVCVNLIRMCCTWVNRINASTCNYLYFSVATYTIRASKTLNLPPVRQ